MTLQMTANMEQSFLDTLDALRTDKSINRSGYSDCGMPIEVRTKTLLKSKRTSLELGKVDAKTAKRMPLASIRYLEGYVVHVKQRNGRVYTGKLFFESGQCVVRNGQHVLTNFYFTDKTQVNTRTNKIVA